MEGWVMVLLKGFEGACWGPSLGTHRSGQAMIKAFSEVNAGETGPSQAAVRKTCLGQPPLSLAPPGYYLEAVISGTQVTKKINKWLGLPPRENKASCVLSLGLELQG